MQTLPHFNDAPTWRTLWLPPNYSSFGVEIDHLYVWIFWITMITFVLVEGAMLWFCFKYKKDPTRKAIYSHGSHKLEVAWTVIPAVILVALGVLSSSTWAKIKNSSDPAYPKAFQTTLEVRAQQFAWYVNYAGSDGKFGTDDDFEKPGQFNVPYEEVDASGQVVHEENVLLKLRSQDVIHSFFVPVLRIKQDAVPGYIVNVWFDVRRPTSKGPDGHYFAAEGQAAEDDEVYEVACAELCGLGHSTMRGQLKAMPRADWEKWVAKESADAKAKYAAQQNEKK